MSKETIQSAIEVYYPEARALRRQIHRYAELSNREIGTAAAIKEKLEKMGLTVLPLPNATAVAAVIEGKRPGPTILVREDIDALPMQEISGESFASETDACHACGHDINAATGVLLAYVLLQHREALCGKVIFVFQPAEEIGTGAKEMIAAGFGTGETSFDQVLNSHVDPALDVGKVSFTKGAYNSASDGITIRVRSSGGHGAYPYRCADPIVTAGYLLTQLQTIISRENPALLPAILTMGSIHGGEAANVIPTEVVMTGTLRTFDEVSRRNIWKAIERVVETTCATHRATGETEIREGVPVLYNDPGIVEGLYRASREILGKENVELSPASPGSDDLAYFLQLAPGLQFRVGSGNDLPESRLGVHNPRTVFDERSIAVGAAVMAQYILGTEKSAEA